jgi:site-specific recombinase XerD
MNLLQQFINYLINQKKTPSLSTVKNYKADIGQFIGWFERKFTLPFDPSRITLQILQDYKKARSLSESSMDRHISSLRKFFKFLKEQRVITFDLFSTSENKKKVEADPWLIKNFKNFLYENRKSSLTIKNYLNDIKSFFIWLEEVALLKYSWNIKDKNLLARISFPIVEEYKQRLITAKFSPQTINRKLSSLRSYISWAKSQGLIPSNDSNLASTIQSTYIANNIPKQAGEIEENEKIPYSSFPPKRLMEKSIKGINSLFDNLFILPLAQTLEATRCLFWKATGQNIFKKNMIIEPPHINQPEEVSGIEKEFYAPLKTSIQYLPAYKRILYYVRYARPKWYKIYHSYSFTHYFHFAVLIVISCIIGFSAYDRFFITSTQTDNAVLGTTASAPPRILSFQGKLTDSSENPITVETKVLFSLYDDENASSAGALWQETDAITPDSDGIFSILLGKVNPIPDTLFSQNSRLFLGITVGDSSELKPRQEIATVPFASNSETLQGLEPITSSTKTTNVVLALDSSGNLSIGDTNTHTFQAIGGNLIMSGKVLSLTTVSGSNSNVEIKPDGTGKIDLTKPIQNSTNNNNIPSALGSVEFDDTVSILATSSSQSALYINQTSSGELISANVNGSARMVVNSSGTGTFTGDLAVNGGDLTSSATTFNLLNSTVTTLNLGGAATTFNLGVSGGTTTIKSKLVLSTLSSNGGILYTNGSGEIFQVGAGSASQCLLGGSNPSFGTCPGSSSNFLNQSEGALYIGNTTTDFLIGNAATGSAKFAFTNVNSGTPTLTIAGNLTFNSAGNIQTTSSQLLTIGGTTTGAISLSPGSATPSLYAKVGGNVGIGTTNPGAKFDVVGGQTQIEISTQYTERLCHSGTEGTGTQSVLLGDCSAGGSDIAEYYGAKDLTIEAGDVVVAASGAQSVGLNSKAYVNKSSSSYQGGVIGVVSTNPYDTFGKNFDKDEYSLPIALTGRIPVKISLENGPIAAGDPLTSSSIPGIAMKATETGPIIGKALEDLSVIDESKIIGYYDPENNEYRNKTDLPPNLPKKPSLVPITKIYIFANISWYDPGLYLARNGDLVISNASPNYVISSSKNEFLTKIEGFFKIISANIKAGIIQSSEIITNSLIITSDSIIVNGQNFRDYITSIIKDSGILESSNSPIINTNQLSTNIISPLSSPDLTIKLTTPSGALIVKNASNSAIAIIDDQGNASFSGTLSSNALETNDASISGTLRAKNIIAESIEGLEARVSSIAANTILSGSYLTSNINYADLASESAGLLSYVPDLVADRAQFNQGLISFGSTSLADLTVAGRLSVGGTMFITQNSIETLNADLSLQSLRQGGLSIMGGLIYIDTEGNIKVQGDLSVTGRLAVNVISPLPTADLIVSNASGSSVLSISQSGNIIASGSGTFAKLNLSLIQPVLAVSATEVIASSSAGVTDIAPYQSEVTIINPLVTDKSVIYITPVGTPSAQTPFLMRQTPQESFTVGVQSPTNLPIPFNWLIVN